MLLFFFPPLCALLSMVFSQVNVCLLSPTPVAKPDKPYWTIVGVGENIDDAVADGGENKDSNIGKVL